ncbi:predicted protein [Enterococcus casseliflavus EC30]|nr:predicted protein [Enterococcus casseliflavus EC30]
MIASRVVLNRMERKKAVKPTLRCFFVLLSIRMVGIVMYYQVQLIAKSLD